jgi:anti-anti-sigma factor
MLRLHKIQLGQTVVIQLDGQIMHGAETAGLRSAVFRQRNARAVVLDLACVNVVDAGGLGVLLELREWTQARGIQFRLINVSSLVGQVFLISCLDSVFDISFQDDLKSGVRDTQPVIAAASRPLAEHRC